MPQDDARKLLHLTETLQQLSEKLIFIYETVNERNDTPDFFQEVKPFVTKVDQVIEEWKPLALAWIKAEKPLYVHPAQINATFENLQSVSVSAFQKSTKKKRFYETIKSIDYVLSAIQSQLKK